MRGRLQITGSLRGQIGLWAERVLIVAGLSCLGLYAGARIHSLVLSRISVDEFESQRVSHDEKSGRMSGVKSPDFHLWSPARIREYEKDLSIPLAQAVAVLRIPKIQLEVPVLDGTDEITLNRAVGLISGTARPGDGGNVGIAGHRDGFFRGLKDVQEGDEIELETLTASQIYKIDHISIVSPEDVSVLSPRTKPSLTLVTCYPFYFVGSAPQRYIVQASLIPAAYNHEAEPSLRAGMAKNRD
jgi:sortase A